MRVRTVHMVLIENARMSRRNPAQLGPFPIWFVAFLLSVAAGSSRASDMSSASYSSRAGHMNAGSAANLMSTAPDPAFSRAAGSLAQSEAIGLSGSSASLATSRPGFWAIFQAALPSLDLDLDNIQSFLDPDDDNDGLLDVVESGSGIFVSAHDTGSDPLDPDSDGDGFSDGEEVASGSDPNDPGSQPEVAPVPALSPTGQWIVILALVVLARWCLHFRSQPHQAPCSERCPHG